MTPLLDFRSDRRLVRRILDGDNQAFATLQKRHRRAVESAIRSVLGSSSGFEDLFDDLYQETWIRAWKSLDSYDRDRPFRPWIYTIARNLSRTYCRREGARSVIETPLIQQIEGDDPQLLDAEDLEGLEQIERALSELPRSDHEIIEYRFRLGLKHREIARILGCSTGNARGKFHRAMKKLQEIVNGETTPR